MSRTRPTGDTVVGARIRARRKQLRLTQQQLADRAGCSKVWIRYIELGTGWPKPPMQQKIADALETDTSIFDQAPAAASPPQGDPHGVSLPATELPNVQQKGNSAPLAGTGLVAVLWMALEGLQTVRAQLLEEGDDPDRVVVLAGLLDRARQLESELGPLMLRASGSPAEFTKLFAGTARLREDLLGDLADSAAPPYGARVWAARRSMGLVEREQAAAALQTTADVLLDIETGRNAPGLELAELLRLVLGVEPD
ncbi:hypothetical protein GCM10009551_053620 [Nocardiopsis tropica]|uniref:helix-turn-helix domain-containing protein n=1 Tax=Tsukamurella strandjordii TaxID=147577 RepID=UPI0031D58070